jgi:hypothetical protein
VKELVLRFLRRTYGEHCYTENTDGGWIISIVNAELNRDPDRFQHVIDLLNRIPRPDGEQEVFIIYKLFIYDDPVKQFSMEATLHTQASDYMDDMHTTITGADDAYVLLRELDAEYLMLQGEQAGYEAKIIDANMEPLRLQEANRQRYVELEFNGFFVSHFGVAPTAAQLAEGRTVWSVTFNPPTEP